MTNLAKSMLMGTLRLARGTATAMGLAVILALIVGLASTALAAVPGDPLRLGQFNAIGAATRLVGSVNGALLSIENNSPGAKGVPAPALSLKVPQGTPPLVVDPEAGTATGLSADRLDGRDESAFFSGDVYEAERRVEGPGHGEIAFVYANCDQGDIALSGGGSMGSGYGDWWDDEVLSSTPGNERTWGVAVQDNFGPNEIIVTALCADFPPLR